MYSFPRHNEVEKKLGRKHTKTNKCEGMFVRIPLCGYNSHVGIRRTSSFCRQCNGMVGNDVSVEVTIVLLIQTLK